MGHTYPPKSVIYLKFTFNWHSGFYLKNDLRAMFPLAYLVQEGKVLFELHLSPGSWEVGTLVFFFPWSWKVRRDGGSWSLRTSFLVSASPGCYQWIGVSP